MARCIYQLEGLIQDTSDESKKSDKRIAKRQWTPIVVLNQVTEWLSKTTPILQVGYIKMTRVCIRILKNMHEKI